MQRLLGPTLGRLQHDFLDPMISRTFNILARAKRLPDPPQVVIDAKAEYEAYYSGPLARAQRMQIVEAVNQYVGNMAQIAEIFPQVLDIPDIDVMAREVAKLSGIPTKMIKDQAKVDQARKEKEAAAAKMASAQQAEAEGNALKSVGEGAQAMDAASGGMQ